MPDLDDMQWDAFMMRCEEGTVEPELLECEGCGNRATELQWIGSGWEFNGCPECVASCAGQLAEEAAIQGEAIWQAVRPIQEAILELTAVQPVSRELFREICVCKTVGEVRDAFARHQRVEWRKAA